MEGLYILPSMLASVFLTTASYINNNNNNNKATSIAPMSLETKLTCASIQKG